jgi:general stress protein 26
MPVSLNEFVALDGPARWGYLARASKVRLATADNSGKIHVSAEWFIADDETLYVPLDAVIFDPGQTTTPAKIHIDNIGSNKRVSGVIDEGDEITEFRAVHFSGKAELVEDPTLIDELLSLAAAKYFYNDHPHIESYFSEGLVKARRWYRIEIDDIGGWDARILAQPPINERRRLPK